MTLPPGISTATITLGKALSFAGAEATISVRAKGSTVVIHDATGWALYPVIDAVDVNVDGSVSITLPHVDQPGFRDTTGAPITMWYYTITAVVSFPGGEQQTVTATVQPVVGQTVVDLDMVPRTTPSSPVVGTVPAVTSVAGKTGAVGAADVLNDPAAAALLAAAYAHPVSTDGTNGLPAPTGVGVELVISAAGLDDIRMNGVSL